MKDKSEITKALYDTKDSYIDILKEFKAEMSTLIYVLENEKNLQSIENFLYYKISNIRDYCDCICSDSRGIGTLMKDLKLC